MTGLALWIVLPLLAPGFSPVPPGPPAASRPADAVAAPADLACPGLPAAGRPRPDGRWLDCYAACVEAQRPRCIEQCGAADPTVNPCLAVCYDAIALGCAIGCTSFGYVPDQVAGATL